MMTAADAVEDTITMTVALTVPRATDDSGTTMTTPGTGLGVVSGLTTGQVETTPMSAALVVTLLDLGRQLGPAVCLARCPQFCVTKVRPSLSTNLNLPRLGSMMMTRQLWRWLMHLSFS